MLMLVLSIKVTWDGRNLSVHLGIVVRLTSFISSSFNAFIYPFLLPLLFSCKHPLRLQFFQHQVSIGIQCIYPLDVSSSGVSFIQRFVPRESLSIFLYIYVEPPFISVDLRHLHSLRLQFATFK